MLCSAPAEYTLIAGRCWSADPGDRPDIFELVVGLKQLCHKHAMTRKGGSAGQLRHRGIGWQPAPARSLAHADMEQQQPWFMQPRPPTADQMATFPLNIL